MNYEYFVSYFFQKGIMNGNGQTIITMDKKIDSSDRINEIRNFLKKENDFDNVGLYNFVLLKKKKSKDKIGE